MSSVRNRLTTALADRYRIDRELGAGGMATVYLAQDLKHDRAVAIKVLHPDLGAALGGERFLSEIRTTARLQHPHILPLLDSGEADGLLYYVMPLVTGETLRARLERERQLPIEDALRTAREVGDALAYAHEQNVIHRDIKPENILLQGGHALVADFGIALAVQSAGGARMTQTGLSLGTPQYMSPEQAMGERTIDARSDIYALGAVTYEMLIGEAPFTGPSVQAIVARVMSEEPRSLIVQRKAIPESAHHAVLRALEKLPADRFATAREFVAALEGENFGGARARSAATRPVGMSRTLLGVAALAAIMTVAAGWGWFRPLPIVPVTRYMLTVDSTMQMHAWMGELAVSPDGSTILYGGGLGGPMRVRKRDQVGFSTIAGTEGAIAPFFSPDGKQVGFFMGGRLLTMPFAGGPQTTLADALDIPEACSWGDDGFIYRSASVNGRSVIARMQSVPGSPVSIVVSPDTSAGEWAIVLPEVLPGAKSVLFQISYRNGRTSIGAVDIASGKRKVVVPQGVRARYAKNGRLLYSTIDGKLWSVAFDADRLEVTSDPAAVGESLPATMVGPTDFVVSNSGTLVYAVDQSSLLSELILVSRSGREEIVDSTWRGAFAGPALSPDGKQLAVMDGTNQAADIWIKKLPGGAPEKISREIGVNQEPSFSPDGQSVAFLGSAAGNAKSTDLFVQSVAGGSMPTRMLRATQSISEFAWSPASEYMAVRTTTIDAGAGDILVGRRDAPSTTLTPLVASSRSEYSPSLSPDGRFMAYASNESGRFEVYVVPFPVPGDSRWRVTNKGGRAPRWSRKGGEIFYIDLESNLVTAKVTTSPSFEVKERSVLFNASAYSILAISRHSFDVMPDDQHFLMVRRRGSGQSTQMIVVDNWFAESSTAVAK